MKLIFKSFTGKYIPPNGRLIYNGGIQYLTMENLPFKIGDYVEHTENHNKSLTDRSPLKFEILDIIIGTDRPGHVLLVLYIEDELSYTCCSWIKPPRHTWRKL
jgi:hypothetical protein